MHSVASPCKQSLSTNKIKLANLQMPVVNLESATPPKQTSNLPLSKPTPHNANMNDPGTRTSHRINLLSNNNAIFRSLILRNQLTKDRMNSRNLLTLPNPCKDIWNDIQNPSPRRENPETLVTDHGCVFGQRM